MEKFYVKLNKPANRYAELAEDHNSKENRKARREANKEAKARKSFFGSEFPDSVAADWTNYTSLGWLHRTEEPRLHSEYRCTVRSEWVKLEDVKEVLVGCYERKEVVEKDYDRCQHSGYLYPKTDLRNAILNTGNEGVVAVEYIEGGSYKVDGYTGKTTHRTLLVNVNGPHSYGLVNRNELTNNPIFSSCQICGGFAERVILKLTPEQYGNPGRYWCAPCENKIINKNLIHPHNYDSYPKIMVKEDTTLYRMKGNEGERKKVKVPFRTSRLFGVEAEIEFSKRSLQNKDLTRFDMAKRISAALGNDFIIIKEDGTLNENGKYSEDGNRYAGFEVVTAPACIKTHAERWEKLDKMEGFAYLRAWETETCGFHVHVSKASLTTLQIGRILMFMAAEGNKDFIQSIAGRHENKYCRITSKKKFSSDVVYGDPIHKDGIEYIPATYNLPKTDETRRRAVNITNRATVEFRLFRGTVRFRHIMRNLQFVDAICNFCQPAMRSLADACDHTKFIAYCAENRKDYPMLVEWMESERIGLIKKRPVSPKDSRVQANKSEDVEDIHLSMMKLQATKRTLMDDLNAAMAAQAHMIAAGQMQAGGPPPWEMPAFHQEMQLDANGNWNQVMVAVPAQAVKKKKLNALVDDPFGPEVF